MGGNCGVFSFISWGCSILVYKQMLIGSMGGLGKKGKKKTSKKGYKSAHFFAKI